MKRLVFAVLCILPLRAQTDPAPAQPLKICQMDATGKATAVDQSGAPVCFVVSVPVQTAFQQFIAEQKSPNGTPLYAGFMDLVTKHFISSLVLPLIDRYPSPDLAQAKAAAQQAQAAADAAKMAMLASQTQ